MKKNLLYLLLVVNSFSSWSQSKIEKLVIGHINKFRLENCLDTAEYSAKLSMASRHHAKWMSLSGILSHDETVEVKGLKRLEKPLDRMIAYGCWENEFKACNENTTFSIGMTTDEEVAAQIFGGWKNSPPHRANMLVQIFPGREKFVKQLIGIAIVKLQTKEPDPLNEWAAVLNMGMMHR